MKVLFILNAFGPLSGAEHVLLDFLKSAPEIDPILLQIGPKKNDLSEFAEIVPQNQSLYVFADEPLMSGVSRQWLMRIRRDLMCRKLQKSKIISDLKRDNSIELVYFNNSFEAAVFFPLFREKKTIVHIHDMVDMFRPAHKKCVLESCENAEHILTASDACRKMLIKNRIDSSKVSTAYNSIAMGKRDYVQSDSNNITIGFVGSAIKRKGFDVYINIINTLKRQDTLRGKQIKAIVITNSKKKDAFLEDCLSKLDRDIACNVYYSIPREQVFSKYKMMDLLLVPSRFDPLPTVVLEASLEGVPVIGTDKDGIPEMQVDKDMLFDVGNVAGAIERIEKWFGLPFEVRKEKMDKAQAYIERTFTAENKKRVVLNSMRDVLET